MNFDEKRDLLWRLVGEEVAEDARAYPEGTQQAATELAHEVLWADQVICVIPDSKLDPANEAQLRATLRAAKGQRGNLKNCTFCIVYFDDEAASPPQGLFVKTSYPAELRGFKGDVCTVALAGNLYEVPRQFVWPRPLA
jgi:hypothetical protein